MYPWSRQIHFNFDWNSNFIFANWHSLLVPSVVKLRFAITYGCCAIDANNKMYHFGIHLTAASEKSEIESDDGCFSVVSTWCFGKFLWWVSVLCARAMDFVQISSPWLSVEIPALTVRVWHGQSGSDYRLCIKWSVHLSGLVYLGNKVDAMSWHSMLTCNLNLSIAA